jgi:hypothetical protein
VYESGRDGQLTQTIGMSAAAVFYNLAMLPGWQKWKPTYRYATIESVDYASNTANISLHAATSTQQGLDINAHSDYTDVAVEYMNCNAAAFEVGDDVLVKFVAQDKDAPIIIGFKNNPKPCKEYLLIRCYDTYSTNPEWNFDECFVYDLDNDKVAESIPDGFGGYLTFPASLEAIEYWLENSVEVASNDDYKSRKYEDLVININTPTDEEDILCADTFFHNEVNWSINSILDWSYVADWEIFEAECWNDVYAVLAKNRQDTYNDSYARVGTYGCSIDYTESESDVWEFVLPTGSTDIFTSNYDIRIIGAKTDSIDSSVVFSECSFVENNLAYYAGELIPPIFRSWHLKTDKLYLFSNAVSWGTSTNGDPGDCANSCAEPYPNTGEHINGEWDYKVFFNMSYSAEGIDESAPENAINVESINSFLESVYEKYKTNGFPADSHTGPTLRVRQQYSIRR